jgi:cell division protein FtsN
MDDQSAEPGFEFVLDNRKLIIVFLLLISFCAGFFVLGFMEGKRQGMQEASLAAAEDASRADSSMEGVPSTPDMGFLSDSSAESQEDLFEGDNRAEGRAANTAPTLALNPPENERKSLPRSEPQGKIDTGDETEFEAPVVYSVQVGAFRRQADAEKQAQVIRSKGYDCRIEHPGPPQQLFLLKVGKFNTRAEAVAMQLRLKQSGFASFIKTD